MDTDHIHFEGFGTRAIHSGQDAGNSLSLTLFFFISHLFFILISTVKVVCRIREKFQTKKES